MTPRPPPAERPGFVSRRAPPVGARTAAVLVLALAGAGCAVPLVFERLAPNAVPTPGLVFPLPYTRFGLTVTRTLVACDADGASVETRVEADAGHAAPDPAHTYLVRPGPGSGLWRLQAKVGYAATGAAKSFNASAEDRSAQAVSATAAVVRRFGWLGLLAGAARAPECPALRTAAARHVERFDWPADGARFDGLRPAPVLAALPAAVHLPPLHLRLVDDEGRPLAPGGADEPRQAGGAGAPRQAGAGDGSAAPAPAAAPGAAPSTAPVPGLPYRLPRSARLQVCEADCAVAVPLLDVAVTVVQGGPLYHLPCEAAPLGRTQCLLEMNAAGAATAAGFGQPQAPAENAAGLAKDVLR